MGMARTESLKRLEKVGFKEVLWDQQEANKLYLWSYSSCLSSFLVSGSELSGRESQLMTFARSCRIGRGSMPARYLPS